MKKWLVVGLLFFLVYLLRPSPPSPQPLKPPSIASYGAVWFEANSSIAYVDINAQKPTRVRGLLLADPVPQNIWLWNESDQRFFQTFAHSLQQRLAGYGIPLNRTVDARRLLSTAAQSSILVVAQSPPPLLEALLEKGWVVVYMGAPFDNPFSEFTFGTQDPLKGDFDVEPRNTSLFKHSGWQSVRVKKGFIALRPKGLDQAWPSAEKAAEDVSGFLLNASWSPPLAFFPETTGNGTIYSTAYPEERAWGLIFLEASGHMVRRQLFFQRPAVRVWTPSETVWPVSFPISVKNVSGQLHVQAEADGKVWNVSEFRARTQLVSTSLSTEPLDDRAYRIVLKDNAGRQVSASFLRVRRISAEVVYADFPSKTFYASFRSGETPLRFQPVTWRNSSAYTNAEGVARFKDAGAKEGQNSYTFVVQGASVTANVFFQPKLHSFFTIFLFVVACTAIVFVAKSRARTHVIFELPSALPYKKIRLDTQLLARLFERKLATLEDVADSLSANDPFLRVDLCSLRVALDRAVEEGRLSKKRDVYFLPRGRPP